MKVLVLVTASFAAFAVSADIRVVVDPTEKVGTIKPMNAVNNGPSKARADQSRGNFAAYKAARIPYARTHDSINQATSNGHTLDISAVFPDFDADENDPKNYDFTYTDKFIATIFAAGTEPFFRLGQTIENGIKKYHTKPPKDFAKWARICEHVMAHYLEGWADGFKYDITYWEIWNEADAQLDEDREKSCQWGGTKQQFFEFYETVAKHLKRRFPDRKIGGPALGWRTDWGRDFIAYQHRAGAPLDFFSWHVYGGGIRRMKEDSVVFRRCLDTNGFERAESILDEWNYIKDWTANYPYSVKMINNEKGGAFTAAAMCACQDRPIDMLMYYDARPGTVFNGMFDLYSFDPRPAYYAFLAWADLRDLGTQVASCVVGGERRKDIVETVAAQGTDGTLGVLVSRFCDDDNMTAPEPTTIRLASGRFVGKIRGSLTDAGHLGSDFPVFAEADGSLCVSIQPNAFLYLTGRIEQGPSASGQTMFEADFRRGLGSWNVYNYEKRLSVQTVERPIGSCLSVTNGKTNADTAWSVISPAFAVTPKADFAVLVKARGTATSMTHPMGIGADTSVLWLDAGGKPLLVQDALGKMVPAAKKFGFLSKGRTWIDTVTEGTVPAQARQAKIRLGADTPNVRKGECLEVAELRFVERVGECPWTFNAERVPDVRETVGKEDFSSFAGEPSVRGKIGFRDDGMTLVDGRPFFPIGPFGVNTCKLNGKSFDRAIADLKAAGCNTAHTYVGIGEKDGEDFLKACERHGVKAIVEIARRDLNGEKRCRAVAANVGRMRDRGVMLAWGVGDDTADHRLPEDVMRDTMICHAVDASAVTMSVDAMFYEGRHQPFANACDAVSPEIYPFREATPQAGELDQVVAGLEIAISDNLRAGAKGRGVIPVFQSFSGWTAWKRYPMPAEVRAQVYAGIAAGARGALFYTYISSKGTCIASSSENFDAFATLTRELQSISSELVARDAAIQPKVDILKGRDKSPSGRPSVVRLLKASESPLLVTANIGEGDVRASFAVGNDFVRAEVVSEGRVVQVVNGELADDFVRSAAHVYRLFK